jgi:iron-sulfur cluster repair protein YtfE (RIC family)
MIGTLPRSAHDHHERILATVDRLPTLGDALLADIADQDRLHRELREVRDFMVGSLLPHVEAAEAALYPSLERILQNRHSMAPMRREHAEVRRLVAGLDGLVKQFEESRITVGRAMLIRRAVFQLYAVLKIHLAEEEAYIRVVDHGMATEASDLLAAQLEHPVA